MRIIETDQDYRSALVRVEELFAATPGAAEGDELELWLLLIEKYEEVEFPVALPNRSDSFSHGASESQANRLDPFARQQKQSIRSPQREATLVTDDDSQASRRVRNSRRSIASR